MSPIGIRSALILLVDFIVLLHCLVELGDAQELVIYSFWIVLVSVCIRSALILYVGLVPLLDGLLELGLAHLNWFILIVVNLRLGDTRERRGK